VAGARRGRGVRLTLTDYLDVVHVLYVEHRDTVVRNAALMGLAGVKDTNPDSLDEFDDQFTPVIRDPEERRALVAALLAGV
jgi:hypothetical protein